MGEFQERERVAIKEAYDPLLPDRTVFIDAPAKHLVMAQGEYAITRFSDILDVRAPPAYMAALKCGTATLTNLRFVWNSNGDPNGHNISVGYSNISRISVGNIPAAHVDAAGTGGEGAPVYETDKVIDQTRTLIIHCASWEVIYKFEFKPGKLVRTVNFFDLFHMIYRAFDSTRLYRRVKFRSSVFRGGKPALLEREAVVASYTDVSLLSRLAANPALGTYILTNLRLLWFAPRSEMFNVSLPFVDCLGIWVRDTKVGGETCRVMVLTVAASDGSSETKGMVAGMKSNVKAAALKATRAPAVTLAFCARTESLLEDLSLRTLRGLREARVKPDYGVQVETSASAEEQPGRPVVDSADPSVALPKGVAAIASKINRVYDYVTGSTAPQPGEDDSGAPRLFLHPDYGVTFEQPPEGLTVESLWSF